MIRSKTVRAPDGEVWTIRRRWAPRPRWRGPIGRGIGRKAARVLEHLDFFADFDLDGLSAFVVILLGAILLALVLIFAGIPLLVFLFETLLIIPVILLIGVVLRVLFRRPWMLEATSQQAVVVQWNVVGWRASSQAADAMARAIRANGSIAKEAPVSSPRAHRRSG